MPDSNRRQNINLEAETPIMKFFYGMWDAFYYSFLEADRWKFYLGGLRNTLLMAGVACIIGIAIGMVLAIFKVSAQNAPKAGAAKGSKALGVYLIRMSGGFADIYTTVIRGTPVLVQLLILYYGVFKAAPKKYALLVAGLSFGINSGAYVCEIIRAGIQSIEKGQTEAGRSLGLNSRQTMRLVVLPQAVKNILPTLFNEFITLLKETSVAGYIALTDLTRAGDVVRSRVWNISPLIISGMIYLILVIFLTKLQGVLERRLGAGDRR